MPAAAFSSSAPSEVTVDLGEPVLIGDRVLQRSSPAWGAVGEHDVRSSSGSLSSKLLQQRHEGRSTTAAILRMLHDPGDLIGKGAG